MNIRTPRGSESVPNYRIVSYGGGSDHMMFIDRKIPGVMLVHSDYTHHTSDDTPDKVDPAELERCQVIGASTIWYLASLDQYRAEDLLHLSTAKALERVAAAGRSARHLFVSGKESRDSLAYDVANHFRQASRRENDRLASLLSFYESPGLRGMVKARQALLADVSRSLAAELPAAASSGRNGSPDLRVPARLTRGPLDFSLPQSKLSEQDRAWYQSKEFVLGGDERFELVNFIDGRRTVSEIRDLLSAEFKPIPTKIVSQYWQIL